MHVCMWWCAVWGWRARVAVAARSVASVCFWMTACCFSRADERCMWRPFGHGSGPVNGTGLPHSHAWVNQLPSQNGPDWTGPATVSPPGAWAVNKVLTGLQNNHSDTGGGDWKKFAGSEIFSLIKYSQLLTRPLIYLSDQLMITD